jgi:condensin complex subunit 3
MAIKPVKAREDMSSEEQELEDTINLRCLSLCIGMLERVNGARDVQLSLVIDLLTAS